MNQYVTGAVIKELREKNGMTQLQLAEQLGVSDKTISKWETGKGYPDITLLEPIAEVFRISVTELISGNTIRNANVSANMLRSKFYVYPVCGNVIHSLGESVIQCHGILLQSLEAERSDEKHMVFIERVEDEYYVRIDHSMTKEHSISFIAAVSTDDLQMVKHENALTEEDIRSALEAYDKEYYNFTISDIEALTDVRIERNKRNGRSQKEHLKRARAVQEVDYPGGTWRTKGAEEKKAQDYAWRQEHPEGRKADCHRDTGLDPKTIRKWWDTVPEGHITVKIRPSQALSDLLVEEFKTGM